MVGGQQRPDDEPVRSRRDAEDEGPMRQQIAQRRFPLPEEGNVELGECRASQRIHQSAARSYRLERNVRDEREPHAE